jgi:hypothetical protein
MESKVQLIPGIGRIDSGGGIVVPLMFNITEIGCILGKIEMRMNEKRVRLTVFICRETQRVCCAPSPPILLLLRSNMVSFYT